MSLLRHREAEPAAAGVDWPHSAEDCPPSSDVGRRVADRERAGGPLEADTRLLRQIKAKIETYQALLLSDDWQADHLEHAKAMAGLPVCLRALEPVELRQQHSEEGYRRIADSVEQMWQQVRVLKYQLADPDNRREVVDGRPKTDAQIHEELDRLIGSHPRG